MEQLNLGYIRVSTDDQQTARQIDSLSALCDRLFIEHVSAASRKRPELQKLLRTLKPGDTMIVHDLDRAFRSTMEALRHIENLKKRGVQFRILSLHVDTNTPAGEMVYTVMAAVAQYERRILAQRTKEGMAAARKRGVHLGRPHKLDNNQSEKAMQLLGSGKTIEEVSTAFECSPDTLRRVVERQSGATSAQVH